MSDRFPEFRHPKAVVCPWCKVAQDGAMGVDQERVKPAGGDLNICSECGKISVYIGVAHLRRPTYEEYMMAMQEPKIAAMYLMINKYLDIQKRK